METTNEILVSFDKQIGNQFAVSASYIWRKYSQLPLATTGSTGRSANYEQKSYTPPRIGLPVRRALRDGHLLPADEPDPDRLHRHEPAGLLARLPGLRSHARESGCPTAGPANVSYSYNDAPVHYDSSAAYEDPTNIENLNGGQYAPESTSSGLGNVFVNAKWIFRRVRRLPDAAVGHQRVGLLQRPQRLPVHRRPSRRPTRPFSAGTADVYLDTLGDNRLPNFQTLDFSVDKTFTLYNRVRIVPAMDIFNLLNGNTTLSIRGTQNASNANTISLDPGASRHPLRSAGDVVG